MCCNRANSRNHAKAALNQIIPNKSYLARNMLRVGVQVNTQGERARQSRARSEGLARHPKPTLGLPSPQGTAPRGHHPTPTPTPARGPRAGNTYGVAQLPRNLILPSPSSPRTFRGLRFWTPYGLYLDPLWVDLGVGVFLISVKGYYNKC